MIRSLLRTALFFAALAGIPAVAQTAMLECVADTSILSTDGHAVELRLPRLILMNFRFAAIRDWSVTKATLLLHIASGDAPAHLDISTVTSEWDERSPVRLDIRKLPFLGHTVQTKPDGWIGIEVTPSLIELLAAGKGTGLGLRDRSGTREHAIHSRESVQYAPYLVVEGRPR